MRPSFYPSLVNGRFGDAALFVEQLHASGALLFDIGDLSPLSARDLLRIEHVFVSHMHMDHFVGLDALMRVNVGRAKTITIVGPEGLIECVGHKLAGYTWDLVEGYDADLVFQVLEFVTASRLRSARFRLKSGFAREDRPETFSDHGRVVETSSFAVTAAHLEHHGPVLGFALAEPVHVNVWANRLAERGLQTGAWLQALKSAVQDGRPDDWPISVPTGETLPLGTLRDLVSVQPGQKIGYITDVRDMPANRAVITQLCANADTLFIEAAFQTADRQIADHRAHLTTQAAGQIARAAGARRIEPFHFSPRYKDQEAQMLAEVEAAFTTDA